MSSSGNPPSGGGPVFGRRTADPHPYDSALAETEVAGFAAPPAADWQAAVARNLRWDGRVSEERERAFDRETKQPRTWQALWNALVDYHKDRVRDVNSPDYANADLNGLNFRYNQGGSLSTGGQRLSPQLQLVTVLDLSALFTSLQWGIQKRHLRPFGDAVATLNREEELQGLLDGHLERDGRLREADAVEPVIAGILQVLQARCAEKLAHSPTWVTAKAGMKSCWDLGPERWAEAVGVAPEKGHWLILLCHRVRDVDLLLRPTMLDAGQNHHHFPSPVDGVFTPLAREERSAGGHPMDLAPPEQWQGLLPELIHAQVPPKLEHWYAAGRRLGKTSRHVDCASLPRHRVEHRGRLANRYPDLASSAWMR